MSVTATVFEVVGSLSRLEDLQRYLQIVSLVTVEISSSAVAFVSPQTSTLNMVRFVQFHLCTLKKSYTLPNHTAVTTHQDGLLAVAPDDSNLLREHPQLFKVHQPPNLRLVAIVEEREVLLGDGEERDEGRGGGAQELPILGHVVKGSHEADKVLSRKKNYSENSSLENVHLTKTKHSRNKAA